MSNGKYYKTLDAYKSWLTSIQPVSATVTEIQSLIHVARTKRGS